MRRAGQSVGLCRLCAGGGIALALTIGGCSADRTRDTQSAGPPRDTVATPLSPRVPGALEADAAMQDTLRLYLAKLSDRTFWTPYGEAEEPQHWYLAAERLGEIGGPAIPGLVTRLGDRDAFVVMQALYALMLASQDSAVTSRTGGEYVRYQATVLDSTTNDVNLRVARAWWERHRGLWSPAAAALP